MVKQERQQLSVIAGHSSAFIHCDCRVEGTLRMGRKKPNLIFFPRHTMIPVAHQSLSLIVSVTFPILLMYLCPLLGRWDEVCLEVMGSVTSAYIGCSWIRLKTMLFICSAFSCLLHLVSLPWSWNRLPNLLPLLSVCI